MILLLPVITAVTALNSDDWSRHGMRMRTVANGAIKIKAWDQKRDCRNVTLF